MKAVLLLRVISSCVLTLLFCCTSLPLLAQSVRCGTTPYRSSTEQLRFEQWIENKINQKAARASQSLADEPIYRIPVVVHVVHQGEAEGEGSNIPLEQIEDQIRILNEDFRRLNPDTVNTPDIFLPVATDTRIEFVLAQQDEDGFPTDGVVRIRANQPDYGQGDAFALGELSQWDPALYFNIWVTKVQGNILGFAQLPSSDLLPGLDGASESERTDGVVIDYLSFGSIGNLRDRYNGGRTTTHEVGHYLGLRHIWGDDENFDDTCSADDFVDDTPLQAISYNRCPEVAESCGSPDMYDNYMDLSDDECMNIFTEGQKLRMRTVLENSVRRRTLLTSRGLEVPVPIADDASISRIITPQTSECSAEFAPRITLLNSGTNTIGSATVAVGIGESVIEEATFELTLAPGASQDIEFSPLASASNFSPSTLYEAFFTILEVNNVADDAPVGNTRTVSFVIPERDEVPLVENFQGTDADSFFEKSVVRNPDGQTTWERRVAANNTDENNEALYINFYDYETLGEQDYLYSPTLDLSNIPAAVLSFRVAYAPYEDSTDNIPPSRDGLLVGVSTDCGASIDSILYRKFGDTLATKAFQANPFAPVEESDWREEVISLDDYLGQPDVQLVFIGVNDHGNNVYLDDIELFVTEYDNNSPRPPESSFRIKQNPAESKEVNVAFNLPFNDDVTAVVYDMQGRVITHYSLPNTLNQTYSINMAGNPAGVYILRTFSRTTSGSQRFILK